MTLLIHQKEAAFDLFEGAAQHRPDVFALDTLVGIFAATVAWSPDAIALDDGHSPLTYEQLAREAEMFANRLIADRIGHGDRVGIQMPSGTAELYVAVLGILFCGAAYVPVDCADPAGRAELVWRDADVCAVITTGLSIELRHRGNDRTGKVRPDDDCWVIFTSGSTGKPKAVVVTHRSAAAFVNAETRLWNVRREDRVLASLSVGFDASCEEMWLAWRNGAALVPCPRQLVQSGLDLGPWLVERAITVISTVPTLAALWGDDVLANVRLLILGGEACPTNLGWRLGTLCEVWNTYGPTEATVVSTAARVVPGQPVVIGWPLHGWDVAVVDSSGMPVAFGDIGELVISGVGLGRYLNTELDTVAYRALPTLGWDRAYHTGDRVRQGATGLEFVGRDDGQCKINGRRIELGEIDGQLVATPGVKSAITVVQNSNGGNAILVSYVVGEVDPAQVRARLIERLPDGIVPVVVRLDALPVCSSGKLDRKALPWPPPAEHRRANGPAEQSPTRALTATEAWLADLWLDQLGPREISPGSNFFELGGTSIAAAKLVSVVRGRFPGTAVADVYHYRRLSEFADRLEHLVKPPSIETPPPVAHRRWGVVQLLGVGLLTALGSMQWIVGLFAYNQLFGTGLRLGWVAVIVGWLIFSSALGRAFIVVAARRTLLGRLKPGRYRRQGWLSIRIWFLERLAAALHLEVLAGTPWTIRYARMNGAKVGNGARLATLPSPTSLLTLGDRATLEADVDTHSWWIDGHELVVGEIEIAADARIGTRCVLMPGAVVDAGAEIEPGSVVTGAIPAGERWSGSPAQCVGIAGETWPDDQTADEQPKENAHPKAVKALFSFGLLALAVLPIIAAVPELLVLNTFGVLSSVHGVVRSLVIDAPLFAALYLISYALTVIVAVRSVSWLIRPGWHADKGTTAWALWFSEAVQARAREVLFPLYSTVYTRSWLRALGMNVGKGTEVSTAVGLNRLVGLGKTSFVADDVVFAGTRARGGRIEVAQIGVGNRTFLGNGAILRAETKLGNDSLVGILSSPPQTSVDGTSWLGLPALELPRIPDPSDPARTITPPKRLVIGRAMVELVRILLPSTVSIILGVLAFWSLERIASVDGVVALLLLAPFVLEAASLCAVAFTIAAKWAIIGRYKAGDHPFWSFFVWRDELINTLQEQLAGAWLLERALATPLLSVYLRAMGSTIGRGVWLECLNVTEFDLVTLGDGCSVNRGACLDTHLIHDRVMRMGPTTLGKDSTLGPESAVLPDTALGDGCTVGARSVVMRGEQLPPHTSWHGLPVQRL